MGFKKHGTGEVHGTEGPLTKIASHDDWTAEDADALDQENIRADSLTAESTHSTESIESIESQD